jgi:hypothetical protein
MLNPMEGATMSAMETGLWDWRDREWTSASTPIKGYRVEATDGSIGKVDEATNDVGSSYIVVDTGPWIFGKRVMLPAGVISHVDHDEEQIHVNLTKDQIKDSPEFDEAAYRDEAYRGLIGTYYDPYHRETTTSGRGTF